MKRKTDMLRMRKTLFDEVALGVIGNECSVWEGLCKFRLSIKG